VKTAETDASTRRRVVSSILEHGPSTAAALADRLRVTAAAVRRHLDVLEDRGLLESREQRVYGSRGRGRPARVFALTDAGRASFPSSYDEVAVAALRFLTDQVGPDAVTRFAESRLADLERRCRERLAEAGPDLTPEQALADALTEEGFVASTQPSATGEQLCQHHCPVAHVAAEFPQLCEVETLMVSRLLGRHVQRLATIAHGDGVCTTHIPRASGTTQIPRASGTRSNLAATAADPGPSVPQSMPGTDADFLKTPSLERSSL
jgi:predicted ArsR family transcriptional regulator